MEPPRCRIERRSVVRRVLIGQLADASGVTATTLRFYEANGLLEAERDCHGYRRYQTSTLQRLARIKALRDAGWSIAQIGQLDRLLESAALGDEVWPDDAAEWIQRLDERLVALQRVRRALESFPVEPPPDSLVSRVRQNLDVDLD